jgi:hypothetical protein
MALSPLEQAANAKMCGLEKEKIKHDMISPFSSLEIATLRTWKYVIRKKLKSSCQDFM